jgi:hypothetical protein
MSRRHSDGAPHAPKRLESRLVKTGHQNTEVGHLGKTGRILIGAVALVLLAVTAVFIIDYMLDMSFGITVDENGMPRIILTYRTEKGPDHTNLVRGPRMTEMAKGE